MRKTAILLLLVLCLTLASCGISGRVESTTITPSFSTAPTQAGVQRPTDAEPPMPLPEGSTFSIHYIDVGQADAALVLCDDEAMLIDGGNVADSSLLYSYLQKLSINRLAYIVCTHPHEDHVGGLAGALNFATVDHALAPVTSYDSKPFNSFLKYLGEQDVSITVPTAGEVFELGSAMVEVLGPVKTSSDPNNLSIVLRIVYGNTSFLFTGDAEREEEQDILDAGYTLRSTVLKVGHHGSANSTTYPFLREVMPEYAVISVGADNSYGQPTEDTLSRLRDADVTVYRTDLQGNVICFSDGQTVSFTVEHNPDSDMFGGIGEYSTQNNDNPGNSEEQPTAISYVLNTNKKKFHYPNCSSVSQMSDKNKSYFNGTRDELISMGYSPCGSCKP